MAFIRRTLFTILAIFATLCLFDSGNVVLGQSHQVGSGDTNEGIQHASSKVFPLVHFLDRVSHDGEKLIVTEKRTLVSTPGHAVIEIHFGDKDKPDLAPNPAPGKDTPDSSWKSILVETTPGMFREIYSLETDLGTFVQPLSWATVLDLDHERILATNDRIDGNGGFCSDGYWQLDGAGARVVDFSPVDKAMASHAPRGSQVVEDRCWALDMAKETIRTVAKKPNTCHTCDYTASITAHFHLKGAVAIPDEIQAKPMDSQD